MSDIVNRLNYPITTGRPALPQIPQNKPATATEPGKSFKELLDASLHGTQQLTFSKHAQARVTERGVNLSTADMARLEQAVGKAREKGVTSSLVYLNNTAFIVNIPNKVVVTVVDGGDTEQTVFTNIDGAVII